MSSKIGDKVRNLRTGEAATVKKLEVSRVQVLHTSGDREWIDGADFDAMFKKAA